MNAIASHSHAEHAHTVHLVLQGKGGVGKSFVAALLAQYLRDKARNLLAIDTDPVNATLAGYKALGAALVNIRDGDTISLHAFDSLVEQIVGHEGDVVVDNGSSSFLPLTAYIAQNDLMTVLAEQGRRVVIHVVVTGGQALLDTLGGLRSVSQSVNSQIVLWENQFFGPVEKDGKELTRMKAYEEAKAKLIGHVVMQQLKNDMAGLHVGEMATARQTFAEAIESAPLMARSRLTRVRDGLWTQLDRIDL